jgi:hypothetical protein
LYRWDYALEERDTEIADLKRRLVEAEHKAREAASKAAEELRALHSELLVRRQEGGRESPHWLCMPDCGQRFGTQPREPLD